MKKILFVSLLVTFAVSATAAETIIENKATNQIVEKQLPKTTKVDTKRLAKLNKIIAKIAQVDEVADPKTIADIITVAVLASPEKAAEIVQAAVEENPELVNEIIQAAVAAGADEDAMIVAALLGGANDADIDLATAVGDFTPAPALGDAPANNGSGGGAGGVDATISGS